MATPISKIELKLWTSTRNGSSTDGRVYLGVAGREYAVNSAGTFPPDFHPNAHEITYVFGEGANIARPDDNDPRKPWQTDANDITLCPMYIRFAPQGDDDNWDLERADLAIWFQGTAPGSIEQQVRFSRLGSGPHLWLGVQRGQFLYFSC